MATTVANIDRLPFRAGTHVVPQHQFTAAHRPQIVEKVVDALGLEPRTR
jgi:hypothetical protein